MPRSIPYSVTKTSSSDTAITISGMTSGNSISRFDGPRAVAAPARQPECERHAERDRDGHVERGQLEALLERPAERRVVQDGLPGSPQYQRVEKPCQTLRDLPALNENRIAIAIGTIDQAM